MQGLDYSQRAVITGRSGRKRAWGTLGWDGQTEETIGTLPDGRSVWEALNSDGISALPPCWINVTNTGTFGDMIWSDAMIHTFVSDRFLDVLADVQSTCYEVLPLEVRPKRGEPFSGYSLLLPTNDDASCPIRSFPFVYRPTVSLDLSVRVLDALTGAGATGFESVDASHRVAELLDGAWEDAEDA